MRAVGETRILDPDEIAAMGREMATIGQDIDRLGADLPTDVEAGPLSGAVEASAEPRALPAALRR